MFPSTTGGAGSPCKDPDHDRSCPGAAPLDSADAERLSRKNGHVRITLYAEHGIDWPLWGPSGLLDEESLPLSEGIRREIRAWLYAHDDRRGEVPAWVPPVDAVGADAVEEAWVEEGERLRTIIQAELGEGYEVDLET